MDALQNRVIAGVLCLLIIMVSSVVGVASTLMPMRTQAQRAFYIGEGRRNTGIGGDLSAISAEAYNVTVIAGRYLAAGYPAIDRVHVARSNLQQATGPRANYQAIQELVSATNALHAVLDNLELTDQDRNFLAGCTAEINSRVMLIGNNRYNQVAFNFNQALARFPSNILGPLAGVRPLELFE